MGASGNIAYFDKEKVEQILKEVKKKYRIDNIYFRGFSCKYMVDGKEVYLAYWGDNATWCHWGAEGSQLNEWNNGNDGQKEFARRIAEEAIVVENQTVWT